MEPLFDVKQAAECLHVSHYTVRSWIKTGKLRATKLGSLVRIQRSELQRLIDEGKTEANVRTNDNSQEAQPTTT
jgi:excisionase family DNA binding protein